MPNRKQRRAAAAVARHIPKPRLPQRLTLTSGRAVRAQGKARRLSVMAYSGGVMSVEGFGPIVLDLAGMEIPHSLPILADHENKLAAVIGAGQPTTDGRTLSLAVNVAASPAGAHVVALLESGTALQASVGADVIESRPVKDGETVAVNGRELAGPFELIVRSTLKETTITPLGADSTTTVQLAARRSRSVRAAAMSFDEFVAQQAAIFKVDPASLDETQMAALTLLFEAHGGSTSAATEPASPTEDPPAAAAEEEDEEDVTATETEDEEEPPMAARSSRVMPGASRVTRPAKPSPRTPDPIQAMNNRMAANMKRIDSINAVAAEYGVSHITVNGKSVGLAAHAIANNWTVDKTRLEAHLAARPQLTPAPLGGNRMAAGVTANRVIEAAMSKSLGHKDREKTFKPTELEAADHPDLRNLGLSGIIVLAAAANGYHAGPVPRIHSGNIREVLGYAFPRVRASGASTVSLPGIFNNVANKELLTGYMEEDQSWREVAASKPVPDFKTLTSYRLLDNMAYEQVGADGKIKHGSVAEESYTRQAFTYAKMFTLTRRDLINDDLGAFSDLRNRLGRGGAQKFNDVFWTEFLSDHSTFFTTARTNYISGSTTNLGTDGVGLGLGVKAFRLMTSPTTDGTKRIGGSPEILLVPPELEGIAEVLYVAQNLQSVKASDANIYANKYRPVVCPWLSDTAFVGYSTTAWYLLRSPGLMPMVVASFLNGNESPTVEDSDADFDTLGVQFRGYHDFGVDQAEYLCGIKSKGAA